MVRKANLFIWQAPPMVKSAVEHSKGIMSTGESGQPLCPRFVSLDLRTGLCCLLDSIIERDYDTLASQVHIQNSTCT